MPDKYKTVAYYIVKKTTMKQSRTLLVLTDIQNIRRLIRRSYISDCENAATESQPL